MSLKTYIYPSSLFDVNFDMGLSGPTSSAADFAHSIDLTSSSLISASHQAIRSSTDLIILGEFSPVGDPAVEGEQKTDTVCLDLKTLEYCTKERTRGLSLYVS
jgi:hypothetical protein